MKRFFKKINGLIIGGSDKWIILNIKSFNNNVNFETGTDTVTRFVEIAKK